MKHQKVWNVLYGIHGNFIISGADHGQPYGFGLNTFAATFLVLLLMKHEDGKLIEFKSIVKDIEKNGTA